MGAVTQRGLRVNSDATYRVWRTNSRFFGPECIPAVQRQWFAYQVAERWSQAPNNDNCQRLLLIAFSHGRH